MGERILEYDVVIIGSGAGGGTVAKELAPLCAAGARIALLEWGGPFNAKDLSRQEIPEARAHYFDYGGFQTRQRDLTLAFAKAVGGSTSVYTGTSLTAQASVLGKWAVPGVTPSDLAPRFAKYIKENNVHNYEEAEINENNRLFIEACKKLGWQADQFPINTRGCVGLATCNLGCAVDAKQGTAQVQIPKAVAGGVELIPWCHADKISGSDVLATVYPPARGESSGNLTHGQYRFRAKKIVVCAGAINSPALLMRSFGKSFLPAIGRYFTCHPALILVGEHSRPINILNGHPKSYYCDQFQHSYRFILETCFYYPFVLAKNLCGFGKPVDDLLALYDHLQMILVLAIDSAEEHNRVYLDWRGRTQVSYTFSNQTLDALVEAMRASAQIFFAAGAKRVHSPAAERFYIYKDEINHLHQLIRRKHLKLGKISISAAHLMGGCRMGDDITTSVTNEWGKVHGTDNIYVADASLFPAAVEINPYLTIMALADRVAEGIKRELGESI